MASFCVSRCRRLLPPMLPHCRQSNSNYLDGRASHAMHLTRCHFGSSAAHHATKPTQRLRSAASVATCNSNNKWSTNDIRCFSSQQPDVDFDIPPLDLTTPSFSIPLPPNMIANNAPDPKIDGKLPPSRTSEQLSSDLMDSMNSMKKSMELDGQPALTLQKADVQRHAITDESSHQPVVTNSSRNIDDRKAQLSFIKAETVKYLDEKWPRYKSGQPRKITDRELLTCQRSLLKDIQHIEAQFLDATIDHSEDGRLIKLLQYEMRDLRALEEYGLTPRAYKQLKRSSVVKRLPKIGREKQMAKILREIQMAFYGQKRSAGARPDVVFDIPPLDLTTPSFSIPLPPNMNTNEQPDLKIDGNPPRSRSTSEQPSSYLMDSMNSMKKSMELDGQPALTFQKADVQRHAITDESSHQPVVTNSSRNIDDRKAQLSFIKAEQVKYLDRRWPRYKSGQPRKITDPRLLTCQRSLLKDIQHIEAQFLDATIDHSEDGRLTKLLQYKMRDLRALEEYGLTPSAYKKLKRSSDEKRLPKILREIQMAFYGQKRSAGARSSSSTVRSSSSSPSTTVKLSRRERARVRDHLLSQPSSSSSTTTELSSDEAIDPSSSSSVRSSSSSSSTTVSLSRREISSSAAATELSFDETNDSTMNPVEMPPPLQILAPTHEKGWSGVKYPTTQFVRNLITTQADGTILGCSGSTSVLCTVIVDSSSSPSQSSSRVVLGDGETNGNINQSMAKSILQNAIDRANAQSGAAFVPLQVEYRQRYHAIGKIPLNKRRRDNSGPLSDEEVLAARVVDRTVRPWLLMGLASSESGTSQHLPDNIVISCEVQSYDPRPACNAEGGQSVWRTHADPTVLAVNSAIAALYQSAYSGSTSTNFPIPPEAAACVKLAIQRDGTSIIDPTPEELQECKFELLYAGTRDRSLMLEFSANGGPPKSEDSNGLISREDPGIPENTVAHAIQLAHDAIIPMIEMQEKLRDEYMKEMEAKVLANDEAICSDEDIARSLGFGVQNRSPSEIGESSADPLLRQNGIDILDEANAFVWSKVKQGALKLFGHPGVDDTNDNHTHESGARIHEGAALLPKQVRGRRENIIQSEIARVLRNEFVPQNVELATIYQLAIESSTCLSSLSGQIHECIMKKAMSDCTKRNFRADGRLGVHVVRPVSAVAPILPDSVHGSALFSRGETQVLCTATLGAPREGMPIIGPYVLTGDISDANKDRGDDDKVPVGSLRFLRNQAEMESDMNTRRVLAGREMTGDSGIFSEVKRAFLHYDFPDFSTGVVRAKAGASNNRRAIGHGNLAEKAILPVLPHLNDFPYTIRMTSEVTSSNGSSSMASACGSSLALLDAGVPLIAPVAGVGVGLAPGSTDDLLLDITGTEDHYGDMDFKICGTYCGITAMQLDVKRAVDMATITNALHLAREGRRAILHAMEKQCNKSLPGLKPRASLKYTAPRVEIVRFDPNRKRDLVGPGGSVLRQLEDRFDVSLDLSQDGRCLIFGPHSSVSNARNVIMDLVSEVEEGCVYEGTVVEIKDFGAVIELLRNKEGLLHVSELTDTMDKHPGGNLGAVKEHLKVGDKIEVLCTKIDPVQGSIKLSRKGLLRHQSYLR